MVKGIKTLVTMTTNHQLLVSIMLFFVIGCNTYSTSEESTDSAKSHNSKDVIIVSDLSNVCILVQNILSLDKVSTFNEYDRFPIDTIRVYFSEPLSCLPYSYAHNKTYYSLSMRNFREKDIVETYQPFNPEIHNVFYVFKNLNKKEGGKLLNIYFVRNGSMIEAEVGSDGLIKQNDLKIWSL